MDQSSRIAAKAAVQVDLAERMALAGVDVDDERARALIRDAVAEVGIALSPANRAELEQAVIDDFLHLGPLSILMEDPGISEIMVNGIGYDNNGKYEGASVFVERAGRIEKRDDIVFDSEQHVRSVIDNIATQCNRTINIESPTMDASLKDGSRVCCVLPPVSKNGPMIDIRRFRAEMMNVLDLIGAGSLNAGMACFLRSCVWSRCNILISGGTGSGKTTMLNCLSSFIPPEERILTIEDTAELQLQQEHVVTLEARPKNVEGKGEVSIQQLVITSLRLRPDRIIVGECRGAEAFDMLQAMSTGHDGSMTTVHANNCTVAMKRLENMVRYRYDLPIMAIRAQIADAVDLIVQTERLRDGRRVISAIECVTGMEGDVISHEPIFSFNKRSAEVEAGQLGGFVACGMQPSGRVKSKIEDAGAEYDVAWFFEEGAY